MQENEPPYLCSVVEPNSAARTIAHKQVAAATAIWHACMERNVWPGYSRTSVAIGGSAWQENAWLAREISDEMVMLAANDPFLTMVLRHDMAQMLAEHTKQAAPFQIYQPRKGGKRRRGPYKPAGPNDKRRKENKPLPPGTTTMDAG